MKKLYNCIAIIKGEIYQVYKKYTKNNKEYYCIKIIRKGV